MDNNHAFQSSKFLRALLVLFFMTVSIQWTFAQLNLNMSRTTLGTVIEQIKTQSKYQFFYDDKLAATAVEKVDVKNASIEDALTAILKGKNISFKVEDNIVYLSEKSQSGQEGTQQGKERTITGQVSDDMGPLIGVNVLVKGTSVGCITDFDGNFTLTTTEANPVIQFSYVGYKTQEIAANEQSVINLMMESDSQLVEEVVVTALGIKRATKALSYNVQEIKSDELTRVKDANLVNSLSGKVAGVTINASSSGVGGASKVVMRGTKGIDQSSNALYVIDGVPMFNLSGEGGQEFDSKGSSEAIADINPEDIESMSVLTGAAAAALYGSHAANGAIVITTKKGKEGRLSLTVSQNTEFLRPFVTPNFQNSYGTGDLLSSAGSVEKSWGNKLNPSNYMGYNPINDFLRTGVVATETVSLSTGTEKNQTYFSASAVNSVGMVPNNDYDRYNFTFRNTTSFLNDKMTLDVSASYIKQKDQNMVNQGTYSNPLVTAYLFPRGDDWNEIKMYERWDTSRNIYTQYWPQGIDTFTGQNPYWIAYRNLRENNKDRYMLSGSLSYKILDWLSVSGRVRVDNSASTYTEKLYATSNTTLTEGSNNGLYGISNTNDKQTYADIMLNINKNFGENLTFQANIGASLSDMQQDVLQNRGPISEDGIPNVFNVFQLDDSKTKRTQSGFHDQTQSVFASLEVGYKSTYYLTLTGRSDWPSQLAGPNSTQSAFLYPSVGGSVILSELLKLPQQISFLKVRGSFASVGLPFPRFLANPTYSWDNSNKVWQSKRNYPMYNLKPERTDSWEVGLTARFLNHFNLDLALYTTKTYNQTFDPKISVSSGYSTLYVQTGSVRNKGIELGLGYSNEWGKFKWSSNYVFSTNKNEILELLENYVHPETGTVITKERLDVGGMGQARFILKKGGSLGDLYSTADLQRDSNGNILVDQNGSVTANYNAEDIKLGSVFAKCNMSWRNDFSWKNLNFGFMLSARIGGIVYSATQAAMDMYGVSESTETARNQGGVYVNGTDLVNAQKWYTTIGSQSGIPQYYTYSATNLRLQEASVGYTIPRDKLWNVADVTVSLVGRNLLMLYCKAPFDPEAVASTGNYYQGIDNFMTPSARSLGFNVRFKF
ncbi:MULTISPECIES: SusC/RagA family TonB-linked outer membrane protein [Bacteroides]|jgi:TonB-linked SusC/RagA family outer membrane protein|uniref:SusC/RagA family TonB-linked outer membrane protein n=1 Tax=Bacteroides TaxID=816 RepID=UPI000E535C08|nr:MULTISPECIES: SusC/RagA family TonB-linked outer membrane protein [Bacteroides]RHL11394.1 SusC/RagA family TonB-linked outer membrane protein [Bacteroides sp. AF39-11AC]